MSEIDQKTEQERGFAAQSQSAAKRGSDDRRSEVRPSDNPAPSSPPADEDAVRKGEEVLGRVKPY